MTFDVRHIGSIRYTNTMGADKKLREDLEQAIEALGYRKQTKAPAAPTAPVETTRTSPAAPADLLLPGVAGTNLKRKRLRPRQERTRRRAGGSRRSNS
jgi:hypothetical protein